MDGTYQRTGFGEILKLVPLAESVVKLQAVCMKCFSNASFTKRTSNEKTVEVIGGSDKYMSVCRGCYYSSGENAKRTPLKQLHQNLSPSKRLAVREEVEQVA